MNTILLSLIISPIIYLMIAVVLVLTPVKRNPTDGGLDFDVLNSTDLSQSITPDSYFSTRDGNEIFYRYIQGSSDVVFVLLHGSGAEGSYLVTLAEKLNSSSGITVVIPDLRGHGKSSTSGIGDISYLGQFEHDLEDINNALRLKYPDAKIILGGHSSGGGLAVKYSGNALAKFDGTILLAPYLGYQAPTVRPNSGGWVQVSQRRYAGLAMLNKVGITGFNGFPVLFFNRPSGVTNELQADSYSYRLNESFSPQLFEENLQANKKPILVLVGHNDEAFYADKFEAVFSENAPHAILNIIPELKHLDLPGSQKTADLIAQWLEKSYKVAVIKEVKEATPLL